MFKPLMDMKHTGSGILSQSKNINGGGENYVCHCEEGQDKTEITICVQVKEGVLRKISVISWPC